MKHSNKTFAEAWPLLQAMIEKRINQIEGVNNSEFTTHDYMSSYTIVYQLCTNNLERGNSKLLYEKYKKILEEYIYSKVLPCMRGKKDEVLLRELLSRWSNYKILTRYLPMIFRYLDKYYLPGRRLPSLEKTSFSSFYDLVYGEMNKQIMDATLSMIDQECAGGKIDQTLVNDTLAIYLKVAEWTRKNDVQKVKDNDALIKSLCDLSLHDLICQKIADIISG